MDIENMLPPPVSILYTGHDFGILMILKTSRNSHSRPRGRKGERHSETNG
jgi:hypothetical protein